MRWALVTAAVAGLASAVAPSVGWLWVLRGLTGAAYGAVIPTALVYVGDAVPLQNRQRTLADVMAASATGMALASFAAGIAALAGAWRLAFAAPAVFAAVVSVGLRRQRGVELGNSASVMAGWRELTRHWTAWVVIALAVVEGALVIGTLTFFPAALEANGVSPVVAGLSVAVYGIAIVVGTRLVRRAATQLQPAALIALGGAVVTAGLTVVGLRQQVATVATGAVLFGLGFSFIHSTLQTWATSSAPAARAATIAMFAGGLFAGSSLATALGSGVAAQGRFAMLFLAAAGMMALFTVTASLASLRHQDQTKAESGAEGVEPLS